MHLHECSHLNLLLLLAGTWNEKERSQGEGGQIELCKAIGNSDQIQIQQERAPQEGKSNREELTRRGRDALPGSNTRPTIRNGMCILFMSLIKSLLEIIVTSRTGAVHVGQGCQT